ncbi:hypothetical protein [Ramlibacter albus]|uniref:Uncharacterized protein n=1 Tax=Ramlibacter albus TaxID=2079448 RepID=A0A923MBQ2_9BURK|nr:hypothetical protein [Ramlibacter albus]MBC5767448.1 hypothetical protein [Ramlibacter albus]
MKFDISGVAHAIRTATAGSPHPIKLGHAQQLVAAALGFQSLAALQASSDGDLTGERNAHVVIDMATLDARVAQLAVGVSSDEVAKVMVNALVAKLPGVRVHRSLDSLLNAVQDFVDQATVNRGPVTGEMTSANHAGLSEIYMPLIGVELASIPGTGEVLDEEVEGHVSLEIDRDRPYVGHRIDVEAVLSTRRSGYSLWSFDYQVTSASLDPNYRREQEPPSRSLAEALADELNLSLGEAEQLVDVEIHEEASEDGTVYGFWMDLENSDIDAALLAKIQVTQGGLTVRLPPYFFDGVGGGA